VNDSPTNGAFAGRNGTEEDQEVACLSPEATVNIVGVVAATFYAVPAMVMQLDIFGSLGRSVGFCGDQRLDTASPIGNSGGQDIQLVTLAQAPEDMPPSLDVHRTGEAIGFHLPAEIQAPIEFPMLKYNPQRPVDEVHA